MPYELGWLAPGRVIDVSVQESITLAEIETASRNAIPLLDAGVTQVHMLVDISALRTYPVRASVITDSAPALRHANFGWLVIYGVTSLTLEVMLTIVVKLTRVRCRVVSSRAEALQFLSDQDSSVAQLMSELQAANRV